MDDIVRVSTVADLLGQSRSVVVDEHGVERSVVEILSSGGALAGRLVAAGCEHGDRVAVKMPNRPLYLDLLAACAVGGFVATAVNLRFGDALASSIVERSGARLVVRGEGDLPPDARAHEFDAPAPDDRFAVFTTSGTTSAPKLVVHTQRSIAEHAGDVAERFGYTSDSVVLVPMPLCGVFGFTVLWAAVAGHSRIVLPPTFDAEQTSALVEQQRVTSMHGTDDMFHRMLATDHDLSSIEVAGYGRFNTSLDGIVERCDARGVPLTGLYGMSEVQALFSWRGAGLPIEQRWRAGGSLVSPRADHRVVDGELQLRGPSLFEGYLADGGADIDRALTDGAFADGWFRTGDLAVDEGDRSFEYVTRMGDAMRLGGFLVSPAEIEEVLLRVAGVAAAQVVAVDLPTGARPVAFVVADTEAVVDEQAAIAHCQAALATYKCPVRVITVDAFPVTDGPNGVKVQRAELRRLAELELTQGARHPS